MATQYAAIKNGKLVIGYAGRTEYPIGIIQARKDLAQIEASKLEVKPSTMERLDVLRRGIEMWEARS